jgi:hypothetical protein
MRHRRRWVVAACCILIVVAIGYIAADRSGGAQPKLLIAVTDQRLAGDSIVVSVIASNTGPRTLVDDGSCEARYQVNGVWVTNSFGGGRDIIGWLLPRESRSQRFPLPNHATRFQVGYSFNVASTRIALACRLARYGWLEWLDRLKWATDLLPRHEEEYTNFWSTEYDVAPRSGP